ncbi:hypothetical protein [Halalkalicoccus salilacus]|uniref:hypothetical protein n=1 Tax=Halalkalicoccus TaxID=332246 RepID=UPI002F961BEF
MAMPSETASGVEWRYDTQSSWVLRLVAHAFVAGMGGSILLAVGLALVSLPEILPHLGTGPLFLVVLLLLVGGPFSLLYLWPMLTDADQRPSVTVFTWDEEKIPWTKRSFIVAVLGGALLLLGLATTGVPFDGIFALVVGAIFSPVVVSLFTTEGSIEDDRLVCNGTSVPLRQVTGARSQVVGNAVVYWISYTRGAGFLVPRLVTVPAQQLDAVRSALKRGEALDPEQPEPDRVVQFIVGVMGVLFLSVAGIAGWAVDDPVAGLYIGGVFGVIGIILWIAGWRGI